ncbi:hypothetical protein ACFFX0_21390 [Citricoccus parietis]|uniref:Uncharacterized protein n=1 Tax=Citricoccus parietis TaxID=592307 RepID=A0ABV5G3V3_9MICC
MRPWSRSRSAPTDPARNTPPPQRRGTAAKQPGLGTHRTLDGHPGRGAPPSGIPGLRAASRVPTAGRPE